MTDGAKLVLKQTILHLERTKSITASDSADAFSKLGISQNVRKTKKAIPAMPVDHSFSPAP